MASVTHAGTTWNTTAGNKTVVATPAANDLIVVVAPCTLSGGTTAVTDNNSDALGTYTQVDVDRTGFSTAGVLTFWVRNALVGSASSTTFTAAQAGSTGGGLSVFRVSGMARFGSLAVRSSGGQSSGTSGTTPAPVLSNTPLSGNPIIAAVCNGTNSTTTVTPRSGYTEAFDNGYNTPAAGLETSFVNSGETSATITFGSTTASTFASLAIELDTSAIPGPSVASFQTANWTTTTSPLTINVTGCLTDDKILVFFAGDRFSTTVSAASTSTTSGSTTAWTDPVQEHLGATNTGWLSSAEADVTADGDVTVSIARTQSPGRLWGGFALRVRDHGGLGVSGQVGPGAGETVSLPVSQDSLVAAIAVDWDALTEVAFSPADGITVFRDQVGPGPDVTFYAGYWLAQAAGTRGYGIATSSTTTITIAAIEVLAASGTTHNADASLTATVTHTVTGIRAANASASLAATATITATATVTHAAQASLTATATHTATADIVNLNADATLTVTAARTATATTTQAASASLNAVATPTASAVIARPADASLIAAAGITATATVTRAASATLTVTANRTATATQTTVATASLTATATHTATAAVGVIVQLNATATITATATVVRAASASLTATSTRTASATLSAASAASLMATAALTPTATVMRAAAAALTGVATITATADVTGPLPEFVPRPGMGVVARPGFPFTTRPPASLVARPDGGSTSRPVTTTVPR